jgi:hypothetical protein
MGNAWLVLKNDGTWVAERGGRVSGYQHLIGPYSNLAIVQSILWNRPEVLPIGKPVPGYVSKAEREAAKLARSRWRAGQLNLRGSRWRQVGGDFGNPIEGDGIWQRGSEIVVLRNCECDGEPLWEVYEGDLKWCRRQGMDWVNWERVAGCCGDGEISHDPLRRLEDVAGYYGWQEALGEPRTFASRRRLLEYLAALGIDVETWQEEDYRELYSDEAEALARWRGGEEISEAQEQRIKDLPTAYLRVRATPGGTLGTYGCGTPDNEDLVETTWGDSVTVGQARKKAARVFEMLTTWVRGGKQEQGRPYSTLAIDTYLVTGITAEGVIHIGCNKIHVEEVIRFYRDDLWIDVPEEITRGME